MRGLGRQAQNCEKARTRRASHSDHVLGGLGDRAFLGQCPVAEELRGENRLVDEFDRAARHAVDDGLEMVPRVNPDDFRQHGGVIALELIADPESTHNSAPNKERIVRAPR